MQQKFTLTSKYHSRGELHVKSGIQITESNTVIKNEKVKKEPMPKLISGESERKQDRETERRKSDRDDRKTKF